MTRHQYKTKIKEAYNNTYSLYLTKKKAARFSLVAIAMLFVFSLSYTLTKEASAQNKGWKEYVKSALSTHPNLKQADSLRDAAYYRLVGSYLAFAPDVELIGKLGSRGARGEGAPDFEFTPNIFDYQFLITLNLLNGGRDLNNVFISNINDNASSLNYNRNYVNTLGEILRAYNNYWHSSQRYKIAQQRSSVSTEKLKSVNSLVQQRKSNSSDLWKTEITNQLNAEKLLVEISNLEIAKAEFIRIFGANPPSNLEKISLPTNVIPKSTDEITRNIRSNWIFQNSEYNRDLADHQFYSSLGAYSPVIDLAWEIGSETFAKDALTADPTNEYQEVRIDLTWKLSSLYKDTTEVLATSAEADAANYRHQLESRDILKQLIANYNRYATSSKRTKLLDSMVDNNSKILAAQKKLRSRGASDAVNILNVELEYLDILDRSLIINHERDEAIINILTDLQLLSPRNLEL